MAKCWPVWGTSQIAAMDEMLSHRESPAQGDLQRAKANEGRQNRKRIPSVIGVLTHPNVVRRVHELAILWTLPVIDRFVGDRRRIFISMFRLKKKTICS
ncbi:hypothetical protein Nepgr_016968 [Nepenthes gracilis]|uniref:Uncharacterized protein n=1 Tax=Nepenthes gracilis TaxID=150966 RepID=A0AAD3SQB0_NEPGR|nr:hypothetical protein Nepgr_016968 [Nepenthes gracilis]